MSMLKSYALFEATLPNDGVEDEHGDVVVPAGKNVADALCEHLHNAGLSPTAARRHSFYGWQFEFPLDGLIIWVLLQFIEPWLLITEVRGGGPFRLGKNSVHKRGLTTLERAIETDSRFSNIRWITKHQFEAEQRRSPE
jgi:hypothetical protein